MQVPASCTLPAVPPWPEEATHPLAPLPAVRQANGVETTRGAFYEVRPSSHPSQAEGTVTLQMHVCIASETLLGNPYLTAI